MVFLQTIHYFSAFLGFVILKYSKNIGVIVLTLAAIIGIARVFAGVHHIEDIIGSFIITGIAALITIRVARLFHKHN